MQISSSYYPSASISNPQAALEGQQAVYIVFILFFNDNKVTIFKFKYSSKSPRSSWLRWHGNDNVDIDGKVSLALKEQSGEIKYWKVFTYLIR